MSTATKTNTISATAQQYSQLKYQKEAQAELQKLFPEQNSFSLPKIAKVCVNVGLNPKFVDAKQTNQLIETFSALLMQQVKSVPAKKAIAGFKIRKGQIVGLRATLRGQKMYDFLLNLIYFALPRTRDFRGLKKESFDNKFGVYSIGIPTAAIFPQIGFDTETTGIQINVVFEKGSEQNVKLLELLHFPFKRA